MQCWGPMTVGTMRLNGASKLQVFCPRCCYSAAASTDGHADHVTMALLQLEASCSECGFVGCEVYPNWSNFAVCQPSGTSPPAAG